MPLKISKKHIKLLIAIVISLITLLMKINAPQTNKDITQTLGLNAAGTYRVLNVEDGDTVTVDMNGTQERIRFIGVDTPETKDPRKPVQCYGKAASSYLKQLIGDNSVRLESDPQSNNRDRYDRLLRYVYLPDGRLAQAEIIKNGYGFAYTSFPFSKSEEFRVLQTQARENNLGLWSQCNPEENKYGGYTSNPE